MTIEPLGVVGSIGQLPASGPDISASHRTFADWIRGEMVTVNSQLIAADDSVRRLAIGDPVNLHQVMVKLEEAKLHFDLVLQVRNKLLEAYQDVMRMQV